MRRAHQDLRSSPVGEDFDGRHPSLASRLLAGCVCRCAPRCVVPSTLYRSTPSGDRRRRQIVIHVSVSAEPLREVSETIFTKLDADRIVREVSGWFIEAAILLADDS